MKIYSNVIDPAKKKKAINASSGNMNVNEQDGGEGTGAQMVREKSGLLKRIQGKNYQGVTDNTMSEDQKRMQGNKQFNAGVAPRVGGNGPYKSDAGATNLSGNVSKKQIRQSNRRINQSGASPQAKKSAKAANKRRY